MKTPFILTLLAATVLAPATAIAKDTIGARGTGRVVQRHGDRTARTFTPPRSTAAPALVGNQSRRNRGADRQDRRPDARRQHQRERRGNDARARHRAEQASRDRNERRDRHDARRDHRRDARRARQRRYTAWRDQYRTQRDFHQRGRWNRNWRADHRYAWRDYRAHNQDVYRLPRYYAPRDYDYGYRRFSTGLTIGSMLYQQRYWIGDPGRYRLPPADGPYRWVRYYNDALLVDVRSGYVADVIRDIFW